jgi:acyl-coenzyme A thioesterase PaaI-like protein
LTSDVGEVRTSPLDRFTFEPHNCFACGTLNSHGLHLALHLDDGRSWSEFRLDRRFEGWEGVAHGGILCTILDEVMAWSLVAADDWGVTARMQMEFRKPVEIETLVRAEGWITRSRRRIIETAGRIVDVETGTELATGTGTYLAADAARKRDLRERYGFRLVETIGETIGETATPDTVDAT